MANELPDEEKSLRVNKFRRIIGYRKYAGVAIALAGLALLVVGIRDLNATHGPFLLLNGVMFFGYGCFMFRQAARAQKNLGG
jgi:hypothetical protein